jgi:steroid 5-alpha reductase family enzyme
VARRNHGKPEDPRYAAMRQRRGEAFWWQSLLVVFWLQALILWIVGWPLWIIATATSVRAFGALDALAIACYAIGLGFEAIGDAQLARFKADPANRGRVMETGLWRYTRHPNYFGDALVWWGLFLLAAQLPRGLLTIVSPIVMTILLRWVSGVTLLESSMSQRPGYGAYVARTSPFLPWWPRD